MALPEVRAKRSNPVFILKHAGQDDGYARNQCLKPDGLPKGTHGMATHRHLKKQVLDLLQAEDFLEAGLTTIAAMPARQVINPLFGLLYHGDTTVRWHAVTAMGAVVAQLADHERESARVIMRRLMWNLNDESGGMGWGSPDAMGEIMARHHGLAQEYACILISYLNPNGNYLEHEGLQQGALWGLGRLAQILPELVHDATLFLPAFFSSSMPALRGLAVWAAGPLVDDRLRSLIQLLANDPAGLTLFLDGQLVQTTVAEQARLALGLSQSSNTHDNGLGS